MEYPPITISQSSPQQPLWQRLLWQVVNTDFGLQAEWGSPYWWLCMLCCRSRRQFTKPVWPRGSQLWRNPVGTIPDLQLHSLAELPPSLQPVGEYSRYQEPSQVLQPALHPLQVSWRKGGEAKLEGRSVWFSMNACMHGRCCSQCKFPTATFCLLSTCFNGYYVIYHNSRVKNIPKMWSNIQRVLYHTDPWFQMLWKGLSKGSRGHDFCRPPGPHWIPGLQIKSPAIAGIGSSPCAVAGSHMLCKQLLFGMTKPIPCHFSGMPWWYPPSYLFCICRAAWCFGLPERFDCCLSQHCDWLFKLVHHLLGRVQFFVIFFMVIGDFRIYVNIWLAELVNWLLLWFLPFTWMH